MRINKTLSFIIIHLFVESYTSNYIILEEKKPKGCQRLDADNKKYFEGIKKPKQIIFENHSGYNYDLLSDPSYYLKYYHVDCRPSFYEYVDEIAFMNKITDIKNSKDSDYDSTRNFLGVEPNSCYYDVGQIYLTIQKMPYTIGEIIDGKQAQDFRDQILWKIATAHVLIKAVSRMVSLNVIHGFIRPDSVQARNPFDYVISNYRYILPITVSDKKERMIWGEESDMNLSYKIEFNIKRSPYNAPEISNHIFYRQSDIYSLALVIFKVFFPNSEDAEIINNITDFCNGFVLSESINLKIDLTREIYCRYYDFLIKLMTHQEIGHRPISKTLIGYIEKFSVRALDIYKNYLEVAADNFQNLLDAQIAQQNSSYITNSLCFLGQCLGITGSNAAEIASLEHILKNNWQIKTFVERFETDIIKSKAYTKEYKLSLSKDYKMFYDAVDNREDLLIEFNNSRPSFFAARSNRANRNIADLIDIMNERDGVGNIENDHGIIVYI